MWIPISELQSKDQLYLILIPMDEVNNIVMLAVYNESIDSWFEMTGRSVKNEHVTHYMDYIEPTTQPEKS